MAENRENDRHNLPEAIPIRDHFRPVIDTHYSGIARESINANNFEPKHALINMVQQNQFAGIATSDPHVHLRTFLEIMDTVKIKNVPNDIIRLRLFPFSLRDQARGWLQSLPLGSITTWQELATKFLSKYFPPAKSAQLKIEFSSFRQTDFEQLYEACERYKELLRRCPNHGFEDWVQIELFYNGLNGQTRTTVDAAESGTIFAKSPAQAYDLLEQMTINSYQWPSERSGVKRTAGVYDVDPITSLTPQVSALTTQLAAMNKVSTAEGESAPVVVEESHFLEEVQYINNKNFGGYRGYRGNPPPNTYHPRLRNHENFSYANNQNVLNPPPGFNTSNGEGKPSFEDLVGTFVAESGKRMARTESKIDNLETHMANIGASLKILESQAEFQKKKSLEDLKNLHSNTQSAEQEEVAFTGGDDKGRQGNLPQKLQDPGEFVVPCEIGGQLVDKAICDSRVSVNIMPSSLYDKLGLTRIKPTELSLQLADKSVKVPLGIVEDVELQIDKLKVLAAFVVIDMENSQNVHVILGRPLLAAVGAIIDVK
ncbi:uncharacterized protein [Primulina huaijiensis]|uniref:uncharacterized protein n=1 Tax=Primulina huaijiensis TaxID=1492673 RepID=UPI003CC77EB4